MLSKVNTFTLTPSDYPEIVQSIDGVPKQLFVAGAPLSELIIKPRLAVVGSRKTTSYGLGVTEKIVSELARQGIIIISGLALGIDSAAHRASLAVGGCTVAVLPTSLDQIYPTANTNLAKQIIDNGGSLVSEYASGDAIFKSNFLNRNRLISGLADAVLVTEASARSGSLVTARYGLEQGKTVMAIPGNITSSTSEGCNNLIKSGAIPITSADDVMFALGVKPKKKKSLIFRGSVDEEFIYRLLSSGVTNQEDLAMQAKLSGAQIGSILTMLELGGYIKPLGAGNWIAA